MLISLGATVKVALWLLALDDRVDDKLLLLLEVAADAVTGFAVSSSVELLDDPASSAALVGTPSLTATVTDIDVSELDTEVTVGRVKSDMNFSDKAAVAVVLNAGSIDSKPAMNS